MSRQRDLRQFQGPSPSKPSPAESSRPLQSYRPQSPIYSPEDSRQAPYDRPIRSEPSSTAPPPLRPQRSAARQPGIVLNNGTRSEAVPVGRRNRSPSPSNSSSYHDPYFDTRDPPIRPGQPHSTDSYNHSRDQELPVPRGNNNRLFQAVSGRPNPGRGPLVRPPRPPAISNGLLEQDYRSREDMTGNSLLDPDRDSTHRHSISSSVGSFDPEGNTDLLSLSDLKDAKQLHGTRKVLEVFQKQAQQPSHNVRSGPRSQNPANHSKPVRRPTQDSLDAQPVKPIDHSYPSTPGFREIDRVLYKIELTWERTGITRTGDQAEDDGTGQLPAPFTAVGLALDLLEGEIEDHTQSAKRAKAMINQKGGLVPSLSSFLKVKAELEKALQMTIQSNYRQFDASVNSYNLTKANVESSYKRVSELRTKLLECRTTFGNANTNSLNNSSGGKGTEMKVFQTRRELLTEMLKIIDTIDQLKQVPERLESLISSKRFLSATVLLVRSLRIINKPELLEISGLSDLRSYLTNQESVVFEILIEELHNHLYLKSYFCDRKWKAYHKGQTGLPVIQLPVGDSGDTLQIAIKSDKPTRGGTSTLQQYLNDLLTKPQSNPLLDEPDLFLQPTSSTGEETEDDIAGRISLAYSSINGKKRRNQHVNPELDSFAYIESLIESLAILGKLGLGLDMVLQRVPLEIYSLVETTLNEVDERHENTKRTFSAPTTTKNSMKSNLNMISLLISNTPLHSTPSLQNSNYDASNHINNQQLSGFKLNLNELRELDSIFDIIRDFFWTLYSKLDATLQSFRVLHEVSLRIIERKDFNEDGIKSNQALFSLLEVWKPIQSEVRALMHDYLTDLGTGHFVGVVGKGSDNKKASSTRRNPMASIAEVLKINLSGSSNTTNLNGIWKDSNKSLFKFKDTGLKSSNKDLKVHETNVDSALKASVPGLVLDSGAVNNGLLVTTGLTNEDSSGNRMGAGVGMGTHRLLVKPDAFYIGVLLQPTLEFLNRAKEVLPSGVVVGSTEESLPLQSHDRGLGEEDMDQAPDHRIDYVEDGSMNLIRFGGFANFLEEFISHTFLPQLEEKVISMFDYSINSPDAFQHDLLDRNPRDSFGNSNNSLKRQTVWRMPVAKSLSALVTLINSLCNMVQSTPFHQEKYGRLIVSVVVQYYQKCHERFKEMVIREPTETELGEKDPNLKLKLAAHWAQHPWIQPCLKSLDDPNLEDLSRRKLLRKEGKIEQSLIDSGNVLPQDLIQTARKLAALAQLYCTLECFLSFINNLSSIVLPIADPEGAEEAPSEEDAQLRHFISDLNSKESQELKSKTHFRMPLTYGILRRFQFAHHSFKNLAQTILFTLRLEIRLQSYYHIGVTFREGDYYLSSSDSIEPDSNIIELSSSISNLESVISSSLTQTQKDFVLSGLAQLLDRLLIENVVKLNVGNEFGFKKMCRNVLALQQSMKTFRRDEIVDGDFISDQFQQAVDKEFEPSRKFWEMASQGPQAVMNTLRNGSSSYSFEQYRHLLSLLCTIDPKSVTSKSIDPADVSRLSTGNWTSGHHSIQSPPFDKRKRIFNECLIELHALVIEDEDDED